MDCASSRGRFDPLLSWEAPWNHMKYFWHNEPEPPAEQGTCSDLSSETIRSSPRNQHFCRVHETSFHETRGICPPRDIIAMRPIPWRNVYPPTPPSPPGNIPCSCGAPKANTRKQEKKQKLDQNVRQGQNVLKFKKTPKTIRYCSESVRRWKEDASNQAVSVMIQGIRDAPTTKKPGLVCENELILPPDYCSFCNQPLSAFGFCNECLPPTPTSKSQAIPEQNKEQANEITCGGECDTPTLPSSHFMDPSKLLHEINNLQPKFVPSENRDSCCKSNKMDSTQLPTLIQSQNMHDKLERDCQQGAFLQPDIFQDRVCDGCQISHLNKTDHIGSPNMDQSPNSKQYYTFHYPKDCPHRNSPQLNSNSIHPGQAVTQPETSPGNPLSHWPFPEGFPSVEPLHSNPNNAGRPGGTMAHFGVTLDVGNASAPDITVVLYANRVLVAEAVNYTVNGEIISAQSWALPNVVDADTLRCYLGDGKLYIVSFPPPPGFKWRFASYPAALGPPKFSKQPCPFEP